jgi:hypothetical protein
VCRPIPDPLAGCAIVCCSSIIENSFPHDGTSFIV